MFLSNCCFVLKLHEQSSGRDRCRTRGRETGATLLVKPEKLAYTVREIQQFVGISRSAIYFALGSQELRAVKCGRRTLILAKDLRAWLEKLPPKS